MVSRMVGVFSLGPSSKVSATMGLFGSILAFLSINGAYRLASVVVVVVTVVVTAVVVAAVVPVSDSAVVCTLAFAMAACAPASSSGWIFSQAQPRISSPAVRKTPHFLRLCAFIFDFLLCIVLHGKRLCPTVVSDKVRRGNSTQKIPLLSQNLPLHTPIHPKNLQCRKCGSAPGSV